MDLGTKDGDLREKIVRDVNISSSNRLSLDSSTKKKNISLIPCRFQRGKALPTCRSALPFLWGVLDSRAGSELLMRQPLDAHGGASA